MDPPLFRVFAAEFTATWNRLQAEASAGLAVRRAELDPVQVQLEHLVNGLAEGMPAAAVRGGMEKLEARRLELEAQLASTEVPAPRLHPNLAEVYRQRMAQLTEVLAEEDEAEAREMVGGLVEEIRPVPEAGELRIEVRGELGAILRLAESVRNQQCPGPGGAGALVGQVDLNAGTRKRPDWLVVA
jgi:hypothetical protein